MKYLEIILVGVILLGAVFYLHKTFFPKKKGGNSCGCGTTDCKVPKPKIEMNDKQTIDRQRKAI